MRKTLILFLNSWCLLLLSSYSIFAQSNSGFYEISDTEITRINLREYIKIFNDPSGTISIDQIIAGDSLRFESVEDFKTVTDFPTYLWLHLKVKNTTDQQFRTFLQACRRADIVNLHEVLNNRIIYNSISGSVVNQNKKPVFSAENVFPVVFDPGQQREFYIRTFFSSNVDRPHQVELELVDAYSQTYNYIIQIFYAGVMLMFSLVSIFVYFLFKDRIFIYFSLIQVAFVFYFLNLSRVIGLFFTMPFINLASFSNWTIAFLFLMSFLFISRFLQLKKRIYIFYNFFMALTLIIVAVNTIYISLFGYTPNFSLTTNILLLIWIISIMTLISVLAIKRDKAATSLLLGLLLLMFSFVLLILVLIGVLPTNMLTQSMVQIGTFFFSLLVFYSLFDRVNSLNKERVSAQALNDLKSRFFTNISHEFRTPLTLIMGPIQQLIESTKNPEKKRLLEMSYNSADKLLHLINQIQDLSKLENHKTELEIKSANFIAWLKGFVMSFESLAEMKNIKLEFNSKLTEQTLWFDQEKLEIVFVNILSNAFKFTPDGGAITVTVLDKKDAVEILVKDTGIGIAPEKLPFVFDRFFRAENLLYGASEGSGIGLNLAKELIELHRGEISAESTLNKGTTFKVQLLKGYKHFKHLEHFSPDVTVKISETTSFPIAPAHSSIEQASALAESKISKPLSKDKLPLILIVEDNKDVRKFLTDQFKHDYNIIEASDGEEGVKKALDHLPELIISDIMMPLKNGFQLCDQLKRDVNTSHIPIILLTARTAHEEKLKGLEFGADDYLTKPFNIKELSIRVRKLIELRNTLRKKIIETPSLTYTGLSENPVEKEFLKNINESIERNIGNSNYSVEIMAADVYLSQSQLNRKLKSLVDLSANKYIQHVRLSKAMVALQSGESNVSETALNLGFSSTAYFVKCFKEKYGVTPGTIT